MNNIDREWDNVDKKKRIKREKARKIRKETG